jgi:hypothetical protein
VNTDRCGSEENEKIKVIVTAVYRQNNWDQHDSNSEENWALKRRSK